MRMRWTTNDGTRLWLLWFSVQQPCMLPQFTISIILCLFWLIVTRVANLNPTISRQY